MQMARMFSNTASTVEKLAKIMNRKNSVPQKRPPAMFTNTCGSVTNISASSASIMYLDIRSSPFCSPKLHTAKPSMTTSSVHIVISPGDASSVPNTPPRRASPSCPGTSPISSITRIISALSRWSARASMRRSSPHGGVTASTPFWSSSLDTSAHPVPCQSIIKAPCPMTVASSHGAHFHFLFIS